MVSLKRKHVLVVFGFGDGRSCSRSVARYSRILDGRHVFSNKNENTLYLYRAGISCRVKGREKSKDTQVLAKRKRQVDKKILVESRHGVSRYTSEPIEFYEAR